MTSLFDARSLALEPGRLDRDAAAVRRLFRSGWELLDGLPRRSRRTSTEKKEGHAILGSMADLCWRFCRVHKNELYDLLTDGRSRAVRVDDLLWRAAELWPGLVPTRDEVDAETERMQADKDGREIQQGLFVSQMLADPDIGTHLLTSMLAPTKDAQSRLDELVKNGEIDLGTARVSVDGGVGYVYFKHPRFLNAEDDETLGPFETAVDLVLLHPDVKMGVLRGDPVDHPKYEGRRIFSAGINLTKIYHGKVSFLFYLVRDLGAVNKLYRGFARDDYRIGEPERTHEKPWMAVVDGFAIGGGCQLLLVVDYVLAEEGSYFNLPARKEGIIPGAANLRLPRFVGEAVARDGIMFDRTFPVDDPAAKAIVHEVHPREELDAAVQKAVDNAVGSGMVSAAGNRRALRVQTEPLDTFRRYMATYAREQAFCHLSEQLTLNLERHWNARSKKL
jgi:thioesterase DpgC